VRPCAIENYVVVAGVMEEIRHDIFTLVAEIA
jgi:hypothetical protein